MSVKSSAMMFICVVAIALAASRAEDTSAGRGPASTKRIELMDAPPAHHTFKLQGPLSSEFSVVGREPSAAGDEFVLKAVVSSASRAEVVSYRWILPEGVSHVSGDLKGNLGAMPAGSRREVEIVLRQDSAENQQVHLQVLGSAGSRRFGDTAQYNTLLERELAETRKEMLRSTVEHAVTRPKIVH